MDCFTYGSLMWPEIMARVCGRESGDVKGVRAWLDGHARHPVNGQDYPGLVADAAATPVQGVLYAGITQEEFRRLDAFEGEEYERVLVQVRCGAQDALQPAWVYRFRAAFVHRLSPGHWSVEAFEQQGRARFCARYMGFARMPPT